MPYTTYRLLSEQIMIGCQLSDGSKFLSSVLAVIPTALITVFPQLWVHLGSHGSTLPEVAKTFFEIAYFSMNKKLY